MYDGEIILQQRIINLFLVAAFSISSHSFTAPTKAKDPKANFGACYSLYNCQGGSMGSYTDIQCRNMGGQSMNSGGLCINL